MSEASVPRPAPNSPLLLKPIEAANALAISPRKLWELTATREIQCIRIGRAVRYDPDDLRAWIEYQKVNRNGTP